MNEKVYVEVLQDGIGDAVILAGAIAKLKEQRPDLHIGVGGANIHAYDNHPDIDRSVTRSNADQHIKVNAAGICRPKKRRMFQFSSGFVKALFEPFGLEHNHAGCRPAVYLTEDERQVRASEKPYWVLATGGREQMTTKWYPSDQAQRVADGLRERGFDVVQVGSAAGYHPPLEGTVNLIGKTTLRQLFGVIHNANGVICPVTSFLHIAAATPRDGEPIPVICLNGGREDPHFATYPETKVLHTIGDLDCCRRYGCWAHNCHILAPGPMERIGKPDKDGDPPRRCKNGVNIDGVLYPKCMTLVSSDLVLASVDSITNGQRAEPTLAPAGNFRKRRPPRRRGQAQAKRVPAANTEPHRRLSLRRNIKDGRLQVDRQFAVWGISRSGNHPVMDWIGSQCNHPVAFRNFIQPRSNSKGPALFHRCDLLPTTRTPWHYAKIHNAMYSFENRMPNGFESFRFIDADTTYRIIVLRDPYNTLASLEELLRDHRRWPAARATGLHVNPAKVDDLGRFARLWTAYAEVALDPPDGVVVVLYNRWLSDIEYRQQLFVQLGLDRRSDRSMQRVPFNGGGSSFSGLDHDGSAAQLTPLDSWTRYAEFDWYRRFFERHQGVVDLSSQLFGTDFLKGGLIGKNQ
jgi:ADP-heptose:LPS heptosyltransferase